MLMLFLPWVSSLCFSPRVIFVVNTVSCSEKALTEALLQVLAWAFLVQTVLRVDLALSFPASLAGPLTLLCRLLEDRVAMDFESCSFLPPALPTFALLIAMTLGSSVRSIGSHSSFHLLLAGVPKSASQCPTVAQT